MPADLGEVISQAVNAIDTSDGDAGTVDPVDAAVDTDPVADADPDAAPVAVADPAAPVADPAKPAEAAAVVEPTPEDKDLEELGLVAPVKGQDNRIPHSRVKGMVQKAIERTTIRLQAEVAPLKQKVADYEPKVQMLDRLAVLADTNPDGYIAHLAKANPAYKKFLEPPAAAAPKTPAAKDDPEPVPDGKFEDGSPGYTAEGYKKLREWDQRQAVRIAKSELQAETDARLGPLEQEHKRIVEQNQARERMEADLPVIRKQVEHAGKVWGKLFTDDYEKSKVGDGSGSVILKALRDPANAGLSFDGVVSLVLAPLQRADATTMREGILKELQGRPAAAAGAPVVAAAATTRTTPRSTEEIIAEAVANME